MSESDLDLELLEFMINSTRCFVMHDLLEEHTKNWNYFLALSDIRKLAKEKYQIEINSMILTLA